MKPAKALPPDFKVLVLLVQELTDIANILPSSRQASRLRDLLVELQTHYLLRVE